MEPGARADPRPTRWRWPATSPPTATRSARCSPSASALRSMGKRVPASFGDRASRCRACCGFLPGQDMLVPPARLSRRRPTLMITFDSPSVGRLGCSPPASGGRASSSWSTTTRPTPVSARSASSTPTSAATAVLAEQLIYRLGGPLDRDIATCLYAGLVTDTGSFKYSSTTPEVHQMAGPAGGDRAAHRRDRPGAVGPLAVRLPQGARRRAGAGAAGRRPGLDVRRPGRPGRVRPAVRQLEGVIDIVGAPTRPRSRSVLKEDDQGDWQVSTRSKGAVDVGRRLRGAGRRRAPQRGRVHLARECRGDHGEFRASYC